MRPDENALWYERYTKNLRVARRACWVVGTVLIGLCTWLLGDWRIAGLVAGGALFALAMLTFTLA